MTVFDEDNKIFKVLWFYKYIQLIFFTFFQTTVTLLIINILKMSVKSCLHNVVLYQFYNRFFNYKIFF